MTLYIFNSLSALAYPEIFSNNLQFYRLYLKSVKNKVIMTNWCCTHLQLFWQLCKRDLLHSVKCPFLAWTYRSLKSFRHRGYNKTKTVAHSARLPPKTAAKQLSRSASFPTRPPWFQKHSKSRDLSRDLMTSGWSGQNVQLLPVAGFWRSNAWTFMSWRILFG